MMEDREGESPSMAQESSRSLIAMLSFWDDQYDDSDDNGGAGGGDVVDPVDHFLTFTWQSACALYKVPLTTTASSRVTKTKPAALVDLNGNRAAPSPAVSVAATSAHSVLSKHGADDNNHDHNECDDLLDVFVGCDPIVARSWNAMRVEENPLIEMIHQGWNVLVQLLSHGRASLEIRRRKEQQRQQRDAMLQNNDHDDVDQELASLQPVDANSNSILATDILLFQDQTLVPAAMQEQLYSGGTDLWAAYLDGCSIVINHADVHSPWIAALCADLQRTFPHAYANVYLTPPQSQAVPAHADDRDVFIIQVLGCKQWKVYQRIPIPYPYPHEQVGKDPAIPVPPTIIQGPVLIDTILEPGHVLYMPRGYVHEAMTSCTSTSSTISSSSCHPFSLHVTVAMATHDWTLAGFLQKISQSCWSSNLALRRAVSVQWGTRPMTNVALSVQHDVEQQLQEAIEIVRQQLTVRTLQDYFHTKYQRHNQRAALSRSRLWKQAHAASIRAAPVSAGAAGCTSRSSCLPHATVVGRAAADRIMLHTMVRSATPHEKSIAQQQQHVAGLAGISGASGLNVRSTSHDAVLAMITLLRSATVVQELSSSSSSSSQQQLSVSSSLSLSSSAARCCRVCDLVHDLLLDAPYTKYDTSTICPLTLLCLAHRCVELGAWAVVDPSLSSTTK